MTLDPYRLKPVTVETPPGHLKISSLGEESTSISVAAEMAAML
jgi:hypothetical protein